MSELSILNNPISKVCLEIQLHLFLPINKLVKAGNIH